MGLPVASGHFNMSGIYTPEVWSGKMLMKFYESCVLAQISNTDYEGEITKMGDKVHIRTVPNINISPYSRGGNLNIQRPEPDTVELDIDQGAYWNFVTDDVDRAQSDLAYVEKWTEDASEQQKIYVDRMILADIYADAATENQGATAGKDSGDINLGSVATPRQVSTSDAIDFIVDVNTVLDEQNIPESERYIVLPSWMVNRLKKSDIKDASLTGDGKSALRSGRVGVIDRTEVFGSNLLSTFTSGGGHKTWNVIAGHRYATTFASQLTKNETLRAESTFGDIFRGLQVFGWKVIKPDALVHARIRK